jgi:hypothetical protein
LQDRSVESITTGSEEALLEALNLELSKLGDSPLHGEITLACSFYVMPNGIKCCNVQVLCSSGCGHLIVALDDEAELLNRLALVIKGILERPAVLDSPLRC